MPKKKKLNSMRILEQHDIPYEALTYDTTTRDAEAVADQLEIPYHLVFKTLIVQPVRGSRVYVAILPSNRSLDLKKIAVAVGEKKVQMAAHKDAEALTGLQVGGISALALTHKNWTVYLDQSAAAYEHICMSAGERGTQLRIPTAGFIQLVNAKLADITADEN